jgi:EAL domain-containing protein (putative c-di-GMP-specific phosphodiesterase class I)
LFTTELQQANDRRAAIERALRQRGVARQFGLVFQPIFDLKSGAVRTFEALARWEHPELGTIAPSEFIPITEQINVIEEISDVLLARAAGEAARWPDTVHLSFNLSAVQLCSGTSARRVLQILHEAGLDPERLHVEVTETALLADFETARTNLETLRKSGARVVLDDFGAGYASISYLREMAFDAIKLDGALVTGAAESTAALRLLTGVLELCASLNVPCIAEHIESTAQMELLRRLGCRDGQGYALSKPLDAEAAQDLAKARLVPFPRRRRSDRAA